MKCRVFRRDTAREEELALLYRFNQLNLRFIVGVEAEEAR